MNLGELRTLSRLTVPALKTARISNSNLDKIINYVAKDLNVRLNLLNQDEKFNVVANQYKYDLGDSSETVSRFAKIDDLGLWWNAGTATSTDWKRLEPKTMKWLDKNTPQWRDASSSDPRYYAKKGRYLYIHFTPDTALDDGFWLYFIEQTQPMVTTAHYPFGYETEIPEYSILTEVIIKGTEYWTLPVIGKKDEQVQAGVLKEYLALVEDKRKVLDVNLDITSDKEAAKMSIKKVC